MRVKPHKAERASDVGHITGPDLRGIGVLVSDKIKEWIATGRLYPRSAEERKLRMDFLAQEVKRKKKKK